MKIETFLISLILFGVVCLLSSLHAAETGKPAPNFILPDIHGKTHALKDYVGKYVVLEWTNYDCPFTKKFYNAGEMQKLQKEFTDQGVIWLSICSSASGQQGNFTPTEIQTRAQQFGANMTAYLMDEKGEVGKTYDAKTTPTVALVNPQGMLLYFGALDTIPSTNPADIPKAKNLLRAAFAEAKENKPVTTPSTPSYGCSVKY